MKNARPASPTVALIVPVILALFAPLAPAAVPRWIAAAEGETPEYPDYPLWVSIEEAAPNGYLRWELLPPSTHDRYRWMLESNAIESPGPSSRSTNPICTWRLPEIT